MKATFTVQYEGNTALQDERFVIPLKAAKLAVAHFKENGQTGPGSYWGRVIASPTRRASREKLDNVIVYTAGFSTGELANVLRCVDCEVERAY